VFPGKKNGQEGDLFDEPIAAMSTIHHEGKKQKGVLRFPSAKHISRNGRLGAAESCKRQALHFGDLAIRTQWLKNARTSRFPKARSGLKWRSSS
jgi:hypothetical protein